MTKIKKVKEHLITRGSITPKEAYELYGSMRLADIIYKLKKTGMSIATVMQDGVDGDGDKYSYARYVYVQGKEG